MAADHNDCEAMDAGWNDAGYRILFQIAGGMHLFAFDVSLFLASGLNSIAK